MTLRNQLNRNVNINNAVATSNYHLKFWCNWKDSHMDIKCSYHMGSMWIFNVLTLCQTHMDSMLILATISIIANNYCLLKLSLNSKLQQTMRSWFSVVVIPLALRFVRLCIRIYQMLYIKLSSSFNKIPSQCFSVS